MSLHDVYSVLAFLSKGQDSGVRLLEFLIEDTFSSDADAEQEIIPPTTSPVSLFSAHIDPPPQSSSSSESVIKVAIKNVAEAGYLNISDATQAIDAPIQDFQRLKAVPQQGGNANSKRKREEIEQGPNKKKQAVAAPTREQSSRYDIYHFLSALLTCPYSLRDANYKNKHVTVRPR